jgi:dipeptidyl aminopeptidase/acylaminoacyl peptidase
MLRHFKTTSSARALLVGAATAVLLAGAAPAAGPAQTAPRFELTVDSIMRGPKLVGYPPAGLRWSGDSTELYFEWRLPGEDEAATYSVPREGGPHRRLSDEERASAPPAAGSWDQARRRVLFIEQGDIFLFDAVTRTRRRLTRTVASESNPRWVRGETAVGFTRENNLFVMSLEEGSLEQLTDVRQPRREPRESESQKYLREEEQKLIELIRERTARRERQEERRKRDSLPVFEITPQQSVVDLALDPSSDHVWMLVSERPEGARVADVPDYVTESAFTENIPTRVKVGQPQAKIWLVVMNLTTGKSERVQAPFLKPSATDQAPSNGMQDKATRPQPEHELRWTMPSFSKDGRHRVAAVRSADFKDRWIVTVDPASASTAVLDHHRDEAWVRDGGLGWMPDSRHLWFLSESDGWMHLYTVDASQPGTPVRQLTSGQFEVHSARLSHDETLFYLTTTEPHPGERQLYTMPVGGGERTRVTMATGSNLAEVSPDGRTLGLLHSTATRPPEVYLMPNTPGAAGTKVTSSPSEEWFSFKWADPKVITFKARDGVEVYARLYTPEMFGARRDPSAPGVVFVHGAGYLQNAHRFWSTYYREYMFHNLLASRGYVVLDVDYRASAGYGRDWRTAIYRHMGGKDLDDIVDGARYLVEHHKVHPRRIGVYGGSYGGFITLMALFTSPDTFAAGAALRPVTDWAHYNHSYTGSILNQPQDDPESYRRSSPIYFAEGLTGALLICHGVVDTNVHFQDSVRLAQRLIELRKENWELALYPVENHGFEQDTSWADQYKRILKLFETNLTRGGRPQAK